MQIPGSLTLFAEAPVELCIVKIACQIQHLITPTPLPDSLKYKSAAAYSSIPCMHNDEGGRCCSSAKKFLTFQLRPGLLAGLKIDMGFEFPTEFCLC